ncbi:MAG TPA: hypothetical protein VGF07_14240, partial [Stellaceae bacterium]
GVSKAGNPRLRTTMIQLAWLWLGHQPQSELSRRFQHRVRQLASEKRGSGRVRKTGIPGSGPGQAVAPVAPIGAQAAHRPLFKPGAGLWRFELHGELPAGAQVKPGLSCRLGFGAA